MDQINALSTGRKLILGAGVLLLIDTFFSWQSFSNEITDALGVDVSWSAWHGFWGVVMAILLIVLLAWVAAHTFGVAIPGGVPVGLTTAVLGIAVFVFALLKNLIDDYSAWASYVGVVLAALVAVGSVKAFQESGEPMPSMPQTVKAADAPPAPAAPEAPVAPAPPSAPSEPTAPSPPDQQ